MATATATVTGTDEQIQRDVLKWDARVQPNEIGVSVKDGVVERAAWSAPAVTAVENRINIAY